MALDDAITGRYLLHQFEIHKTEAVAGDLCRWYSHEAVAAFARASMSDTPYPNTGDQPMSFTSAGIMLGLVSNIKEFPPQVRDWARSIESDSLAFYGERKHEAESIPLERRNYDWDKGYRFEDRNREVAQKWWRANEKAVTEGRLQDAVPGEAFVSPSKFLQGVTEVWRPIAKTTNAVSSGQISISNQAATKSGDKRLSEDLAERASKNYVIYAVLAVLLAGIAIYFRKRLFRKQ